MTYILLIALLGVCGACGMFALWAALICCDDAVRGLWRKLFRS